MDRSVTNSIVFWGQSIDAPGPDFWKAVEGFRQWKERMDRVADNLARESLDAGMKIEYARKK